MPDVLAESLLRHWTFGIAAAEAVLLPIDEYVHDPHLPLRICPRDQPVTIVQCGITHPKTLANVRRGIRHTNTLSIVQYVASHIQRH